MPRSPRSTLPEYGAFHVTAKGVAAGYVFLDDIDRDRFRMLLRRVVAKLDWQLHAWCLMGTHFHLLIQAELARVSVGMHWLAGVYAQGFNERWVRKGHLYEERFGCWVIRDEDHFQAAVEYILNNPVRAGLCKNRCDWPWSGPKYTGRLISGAVASTSA